MVGMESVHDTWAAALYPTLITLEGVGLYEVVTLTSTVERSVFRYLGSPLNMAIYV